MMKELLKKCTQDQLVQFANDCLNQTRVYVNTYAEDITLRGAKHIGMVVAEYTGYVKTTTGMAAINAANKSAKYTAECADLVCAGTEVEYQRQIEFLKNMLGLDQ